MKDFNGMLHFILFWGFYAFLAYLVVNLVK
jgi:hypothetical protein